MKRAIFAFARDRKDVLFYLQKSARPAIADLISIFLYHDSDVVNHWKVELVAHLSSVPLCKQRNPYLRPAVILDATWGTWEDQFDSIVIRVINKEGHSFIKENRTHLYDAIEAYFQWLSQQLSKQTDVADEDIYRAVDDIYDQYFGDIATL